MFTVFSTSWTVLASAAQLQKDLGEKTLTEKPQIAF